MFPDFFGGIFDRSSLYSRTCWRIYTQSPYVSFFIACMHAMQLSQLFKFTLFPHLKCTNELGQEKRQKNPNVLKQKLK